MKNNTILLLIFIAVLALGSLRYFLNSKTPEILPIENPVVSNTSVVYSNTDFGFNFSLPNTWKGYTVINDTWEGNILKGTAAQSGPKLLVRNPKWTTSAPYEDLPILVFTIPQWEAYLAEEFSVSAAPIQASELARNTTYVFALPARWDFDYSLGYKEAQEIFARKSLQPFDVKISKGKLNINLICEQATAYMQFADAKSLEVFLAGCKEGKNPEVIERYKADRGLGDGAKV